MPFKSKAQQRFMFAAEERGQLPKGTAKRWAHETKSIRRLPERTMTRKEALLKAYRMGKQAGIESALTRFLTRTAPVLAPAAAGAYVSQDSPWTGALIGAALGGLGARLGTKATQRMFFKDPEALQKAEALAKATGKLTKEEQQLAQAYRSMQQATPASQYAGRILAGGLGGGLASAFGGRTPRVPFYSSGAQPTPAVRDMGSHYYAGLV